MAEKRGSPAPTESAIAKKQRVESDDAFMVDNFTPDFLEDAQDKKPDEIKYPSTQHYNARCGIQRSIALVASHVGFDSTSPQVMESFTGLVEACMSLCNSSSTL